MKKEAKVVLITSLVSLMALTGCASNDKLIEQQNQHVGQIESLETKVNVLELQVAALETKITDQNTINIEVHESIHKLNVKQNRLNDDQSQLSSHVQQQIDVSERSYTIKQRDTLYNISKRFNMSIEELQKLNPQIQNPKNLLIGQIITVK